MRAALLSGLVALVISHLANKDAAVDSDRAIPRFILLKGMWVCVDRNPRELNRRFCRAQSPSKEN